ncbi:MAG: class I SAM-dependent methyltransferase [Alphaproteobacteria bacterium]
MTAQASAKVSPQSENYISTMSKCRLCGSKHIHSVLDMGSMALTGVFPRPEQPDPLTSPLELVICEDCKFVQSRHTVDPSLMYQEYWYRSGTNQTMRDHLKGVVVDVLSHTSVNAGDIVIDTGCNDGTLLSNYDPSVERIGVDPSNAVQMIKDKNIKVVNNFFTARNVSALLGNRKAKAITSISMFYDLDRPHDFVSDIASCLTPDGVWVVEMNYTGNMIHTLGYDMISQEHIAYYTLRVFERLINEHKLYINDISFNTINGGSIRFICGFLKKETPLVAEIREKELKDGLEDIATYTQYGQRINAFKSKLLAFLKDAKSKGHRVGAYGASTRGNTVLQHCGITRDLVYAAADRLPMKVGLETSGSRIPIISEGQARKDNPEYMLVLPYYFLPEFIIREKEYLQNGGKFIVPLPELRLISWDKNKPEHDVTLL